MSTTRRTYIYIYIYIYHDVQSFTAPPPGLIAASLRLELMHSRAACKPAPCAVYPQGPDGNISETVYKVEDLLSSFYRPLVYIIIFLHSCIKCGPAMHADCQSTPCARTSISGNHRKSLNLNQQSIIMLIIPLMSVGPSPVVLERAVSCICLQYHCLQYAFRSPAVTFPEI